MKIDPSIVKNSNWLSQLSGTDSRRIRLQDAAIDAFRENNLNFAVVSANKAYDDFVTSGRKAEEFENARANVNPRERRASYIDVIGAKRLEQLSNINTSVADVVHREIMKDVNQWQKENKTKDLPPVAIINDFFDLNTMGALVDSEAVELFNKKFDNKVANLLLTLSPTLPSAKASR